MSEMEILWIQNEQELTDTYFELNLLQTLNGCLKHLVLMQDPSLILLPSQPPQKSPVLLKLLLLKRARCFLIAEAFQVHFWQQRPSLGDHQILEQPCSS